jgi:hypothetical protein
LWNISSMKGTKTYNGIPPEGVTTPNGYLFCPPTQGVQILFMVSAFFTAIFLGWFISSVAGIGSDFASGVIYFVFLLIFFFGYGLWVSFVSALAFSSIKWPIIKVLVKLFIKKEKPNTINDFLPEREKLIELLVRVQKHSRWFFIICWPIGILGGFTTLFMNSSLNPSLLFMFVFISSVIYGYTLSYFGRRGYLPLPEE